MASSSSSMASRLSGREKLTTPIRWSNSIHFFCNTLGPAERQTTKKKSPLRNVARLPLATRIDQDLLFVVGFGLLVRRGLLFGRHDRHGGSWLRRLLGLFRRLEVGRQFAEILTGATTKTRSPRDTKKNKSEGTKQKKPTGLVTNCGTRPEFFKLMACPSRASTSRGSWRISW